MSRKFSLGGKSVMFLCVIAALVLLNRPVATQQQVPGDDVAQAGPEETQAAFAYAGGAVEGVRKRTNDVQTTLAVINGPYVNLPIATLSWPIPAGDSDLLNVSFEAECALRRAAPQPNLLGDWVEIRAMISAVPARAGYPKFMEPNDAVTAQALCSAQTYSMNHASWADRPTPVNVLTNYTVQIQWRIEKNSGAATPVFDAWVDDWEMALLAFN